MTTRASRRVAAILAFLVVIVLLPVVGVAILAPSALRSLLGTDAPDYPGPGTGQVLVHILPGSTALAIGRVLQSDGVVRSAAAFRNAAANDDRSIGLQPGYFRLRLQMKAVDALGLLLDPKSRVRSRVTIPEGTHESRILRLIAAGSEVPLASLEAAAANPLALGLPAYADGHLEGFLFPATYDIDPRTSAVEVLTTMTERFSEEAAALNLEQAAAAIHLTPLQVVTLASIIERESAAPADRAKVARVFLNRLARGMTFGSEATVRYALGYPDRPLNRDDIRVDSPYNTYVHTGFPPGPICSPGDAALQAALNPTPGTWLYFFTRSDGTTVFSNTDAEFQASQRGNG